MHRRTIFPNSPFFVTKRLISSASRSHSLGLGGGQRSAGSWRPGVWSALPRAHRPHPRAGPGLVGGVPHSLDWTRPWATQSPAFVSGPMFSFVTRGCVRTPWAQVSHEGRPGDSSGAGHTEGAVIKTPTPRAVQSRMGQEVFPADQTPGENRDFGRGAPRQVVPMTEPLGMLGRWGPASQVPQLEDRSTRGPSVAAGREAVGAGAGPAGSCGRSGVHGSPHTQLPARRYEQLGSAWSATLEQAKAPLSKAAPCRPRRSDWTLCPVGAVLAG